MNKKTFSCIMQEISKATDELYYKCVDEVFDRVIQKLPKGHTVGEYFAQSNIEQEYIYDKYHVDLDDQSDDVNHGWYKVHARITSRVFRCINIIQKY